MRYDHRLEGAWFLAIGLLLACGGGGSEGGAPEADAGAVDPPAAAGIPVSAPSGPVDASLAESGESLFRQKGCAACHTIGGGRLTGPDLAGVTERREFEWVYHQVTNPDSMIRNDETTRQLMNEYMTPMPDLGITEDEFVALYEYLRAEGGEAAE